MTYKKQKLNRNIIPQTIASYLGHEITPIFRKNANCDIYRYNIDPESMLDIYYNTDSTTTLCCIGKKAEIAEGIAQEIIDNCSLTLPNPIRALYLKGFDQEKLDIVLQNIEKNRL